MFRIGEFAQIAQVSGRQLRFYDQLGLLQPATRALGPVLYSQIEGALLGTPLPAAQSFLLIWPQLTGLVAEMILIFTAAYVAFQRQEIRA